MAQSLEFQQHHLDHVSRSFAFCIRKLPQPLGRWVGLTYLVCRILDTIEDAKWPDQEMQSKAFQKFEAAVGAKGACANLDGWESNFPKVSDSERNLLADAHLVLRDLHELPENVRRSIQDLVLSMSSGMKHFLARRKSGTLRLTSLAEVNQYCFFVAGLVGEALMQIVSSVEPLFPSSMSNLLRAHHFGLFLQKVNILKDQPKDEGEGRLFVPSREEVEASAGSDAREALEFLCSIPQNQMEFRQFCGWSLFLGIETLIVSKASFLHRTMQKISRVGTQSLLNEVDKRIASNDRLRDFFNLQCQRLQWPSDLRIPIQHASPEWLPLLYRGRLDANSLVRLGI